MFHLVLAHMELGHPMAELQSTDHSQTVLV
jgi:hypothetical protein